MSDECQSLSQRAYGKNNPTEVELAAADKCNKDFQNAMEQYNRNVFIPITVIGFIALAGGALFLSEVMGPVAPGLVFGGVITILYGSIRGFDAIDKRWLFLELLILLIGLILVTQKYLSLAAKKRE